VNVAPKFQTLGARILAAIVDTFVFMPLFVAETVLDEQSPSHGLFVFISVSATIVWHVYYVYLHGRYGQTLGKIVAKIKVVAADETPIGYRTAFIREVLYLPVSLAFTIQDVLRVDVSDEAAIQSGLASWIDIVIYVNLVILAADILVALTNDKRRSLHDMIAGTVVVRLDAQ
jgi:uncharacterized RDD family membrane protein YckC